MIITGGPTLLRGTTLGYVGESLNNNNILAFQLLPSALMNEKPRYIVIPIPGRLISLWCDTRSFKGFFMEMLRQCLPSDRVKGLNGRVNFEEATFSESLDAIYSSDINQINEITVSRWGSPALDQSLVSTLSSLKPNWSYVVAKIDKKQLNKIHLPIVIVYEGPRLVDSKNTSLLYFPGFENTDPRGIYGGLPELSAIVNRSLLLFIGTKETSHSVKVTFSEKTPEDLFAQNICYSHFTQNTMNGDFYYRKSSETLAIKLAQVPILDTSATIYNVDGKRK